VYAYNLFTNYTHTLKHKPFMYVKNKFMEVLSGKQGEEKIKKRNKIG